MTRRLSSSLALEVIPVLAAFLVLPLALAPALAPAFIGVFTQFIFGLAGLGALALVALVAFRLADFWKTRRAGSKPGTVVASAPDGFPREAVAEPVAPLADMGERLRRIDWYQFEKVVAWAFSQDGYQVTRLGGADAEIHLVIEREGQRMAVLCKQWQNWKSGVKVAGEFLGTIKDHGFERGLLVTLNACRGEVEQFALKHGIQILTEQTLLKMLGADSGHPELEELLNDRRKMCPKCESEMVVRTSRPDGNRYWACSSHPRCQHTVSFQLA